MEVEERDIFINIIQIIINKINETSSFTKRTISDKKIHQNLTTIDDSLKNIILFDDENEKFEVIINKLMDLIKLLENEKPFYFKNNEIKNENIVYDNNDDLNIKTINVKDEIKLDEDDEKIDNENNYKDLKNYNELLYNEIQNLYNNKYNIIEVEKKEDKDTSITQQKNNEEENNKKIIEYNLFLNEINQLEKLFNNEIELELKLSFIINNFIKNNDKMKYLDVPQEIITNFYNKFKKNDINVIDLFSNLKFYLENCVNNIKRSRRKNKSLSFENNIKIEKINIDNNDNNNNNEIKINNNNDENKNINDDNKYTYIYNYNKKLTNKLIYQNTDNALNHNNNNKTNNENKIKEEHKEELKDQNNKEIEKEQRYINIYTWNWKDIINEFSFTEEYESEEKKLISEFNNWEVKFKLKYKNKRSLEWINNKILLKEKELYNIVKFNILINNKIKYLYFYRK
jgi:hypothetical protein